MIHTDALSSMRALGVVPRGVVHVGAFDGEELDAYERYGFKKIVMIEPNPVAFTSLVERCRGHQNVICVCCAVTSSNRMVDLRIASNGESSSLYPMKHHAVMYPGIFEVDVVKVPGLTLTQAMASAGVDAADYNVLVMDTQGSEVDVLAGADLTHFECVTSEINFREMYEGGATADKLDAALEGYARCNTLVGPHPEWGDAVYIRRSMVAPDTNGPWTEFSIPAEVALRNSNTYSSIERKINPSISL